MANENKTAKEYVQKGYLIAHLANCGIQTINYDEWERLCECIHEAKPADVVDRINECSKCVLYPFKQLRERLEANMVEVVLCKDCVYWEQATDNSGNCNRALEITAYGSDYCSYGERRKDER